MKRFAIAVVLAGMASTVYAVDGNAVLGGALGGGAGAAIGSAVGGRDGAIIGGAIGGAAGTAVATSGSGSGGHRETVIVREREQRHDNGLHLGQYKRHKRHDD